MINTLIKKIKGAQYILPTDNIDVSIWNDWYNGNVKNVHQYSIYNGKHNVPMRMLSLQMAKKVCEDWSNILINEQTNIILDTEDATNQLNTILDDSNFWVKANEGVELSFALGLGAFVISVFDLLRDVNDGRLNKDKAKIKVDFVDRHKITPISFVDKNIDEIGFTFRDSHYTTYILHLRDASRNYVIHSYIYDKFGELVNTFSFDTKSDQPWFQVLRPFISNNKILAGSETINGVSIFANSLDTLKAIDTKYDGFHLEYVLGRRRLYVSDEMWQVHNKKDGSQEKTFDPFDALHYILPSSNNDKQLIEDPTGDLRAEGFITGINTELNILSSKVGMGENYYRFDYKTGTPTATQVISENSALFRSKTKHEILIESVLIGLTNAIIYASNEFTNNTFTDVKEIKIDFDDSIIEDKSAMMERDKNLVLSNLMSHIEFRIKWLDEPSEEAEANYRKHFKADIINKLLPALVQGALSPEEFVLEVYGEERQKEVDYITDKLSMGGFDDFASLYGGDE